MCIRDSWTPGEKCPPLIVSHGLFDDVVPIDASRIIHETVKSKSTKFCELIEFDGSHQIDPNLMDYINLKIKEFF